MGKAVERYTSIDGLRAYGALGIVLMHIRANETYEIGSYIYNTLIHSFTDFVVLFMIISGFSMCCGYYDRIKNGEISLNEFYSRRFAKIWPYFAVLVLLELIVEPKLNILYECFADWTLAFAFLPNPHITVIGVGRTLGVIFAFYMLFPFFVFLTDNKRRAWFVFFVSVVYNLVCTRYFFGREYVSGTFYCRTNILYCFIFFMAGGLIYLYRHEICDFVKRFRWPFLVFAAMVTAGGVAVFDRIDGEGMAFAAAVETTVVFSLWLMYAIATNGKLLNNRATKFLGGISMEIYLSHMVCLRVIEKLKLVHIFENDALSFVAASVMTVGLTIAFAVVLKKALSVIGGVLKRRLKGAEGK